MVAGLSFDEPECQLVKSRKESGRIWFPATIQRCLMKALANGESLSRQVMVQRVLNRAAHPVALAPAVCTLLCILWKSTSSNQHPRVQCLSGLVSNYTHGKYLATIIIVNM